MIVVEKEPGTKIEYSAAGNMISFRDGELSLDLSRFERDFPVHIDICENAFRMLTMGISRKYVAQIDIPARKYTEVQDGVDEEGNPKMVMQPVPFSMDNVTLTLWEVE